MARSATAIVPRVLGFIPLLATLLCIVLLLTYRPRYYAPIVFGISGAYLFGGFFFFFLLKKARKLKKDKELAKAEKLNSAGTAH